MIRDEATVDYVQSAHGFLTPASVVHRHLVDGKVITENLYRYEPFKMFSADAEIKFTELETPPPPPPPSRNEPHPLPSRLRLLPGLQQSPILRRTPARRRRRRSRSPIWQPAISSTSPSPASLRVIEQAAAGEPVALIGSSMGGYLAALYAARHPEVSRVVLLAPAFGFARRWAERMGADAVAAWREHRRRRRLSLRREPPAPRSPPPCSTTALRYEDYPDFRQPALIFHGAQDDVVPAAYSEEFAATHPNAQPRSPRLRPRTPQRAGVHGAPRNGFLLDVVDPRC